MSELKAYYGDVYIPVYGSIADAKVYLKSEADKVIAHHKYKRCLDKAEMCQAKYDEEDAKVNGRGASWDFKNIQRQVRWALEKLVDKEAK